MVQISLVLSPSLANTELEAFATQARRQLEESGHPVELLAMPVATDDDGVPIGLASAATRGLRQASGEIVVVVDPSMGYSAEDIRRLVSELIDEQADVVVATRPLPIFAQILRKLVGTSDPMSGLFAVSDSFRDEVVEGLDPIGSKLLWPLLGTKTGRWIDLSVKPRRDSRPKLLGFNDVREFKRFADERFGNISRLIQFCIVGASGMMVDLTSYMLFQKLLRRTYLHTMAMPLFGGTSDLAVARALAIAIALCWNFSLNRRLTFNYARRGSVVRQFMTYALSNAPGMAVSYTLSIALPEHVAFFADHKLAAAVVGIVLATGISFTMSRWVVFSKRVEPVVAVESV